ncbi:MAG: class I SAM-dependent methyltransferase [Thermodesulfobacteriota bacterium]
MTGPRFKDHFSTDSPAYHRFRPSYPERLFAWLAEMAPGRALAWDCATGTGQAARGLAGYFSRVVATDASLPQLLAAPADARVSLVTARAEAPPFPAACLDLITVAQALHWFDTDRFFAQALRVLRPRGVIAVWSYGLLTVTEEIDRIILRLYGEVLDNWWPPERRLLENGYRDIPFPFPPLAAPRFSMTADWPLAGLLGYLATWSAVQRFRAATGADPLAGITAELRTAWGDPGQPRRITWPLGLQAGISLPDAAAGIPGP